MNTCVFLSLPDEITQTPFIRGQGPEELSWEKGIAFTKLGKNEWLWESRSSFKEGYFMISLCDEVVEQGLKHPLIPGASIQVNPKFPTGALTF